MSKITLSKMGTDLGIHLDQKTDIYFESTARGATIELEVEGYEENVRKYAEVSKEDLRSIIERLTTIYEGLE